MLLSISWQTCAATDLNKMEYCEKERDQAEKTVEICDKTVESSKQVNTLLNKEIEKQQEIITTQTKEVVSKSEEIGSLKESNSTGKIIWGVIGFVLGVLILHVPIHLG